MASSSPSTAVSFSDTSSTSASHDDRQRILSFRRRRGDEGKESLKIRDKKHFKAKRRRRRRSSPDGLSSSYSTDDYSSSSESKEERSRHSRRRKHHDKSKKSKTRDKERSSRQTRRKHKKEKHEVERRSRSPVQLSKFLGRSQEDGIRRSAVSGKKIQMKLEKSKEDKEAESKRSELLKFLNASYD